MKISNFIKSLVVLSLLSVSSLAIANPVPTVSDVPSVGDTIKVYSGNDRFPGFGGGDFNLSTGGQLYTAFCLEKFEYVYFGAPLTVFSVGDFAQNDAAWGAKNGSVNVGGEYKDFISNETRYIMSEYVTNYNNFYASFGGTSTKSEFSSRVQESIWFFENETRTNTDTLTNFIKSLDLSVMSDKMSNVTVINPVNGNGYHMQSLLITSSPVPEPATLFLFGTGLAGLAGYSRRRKNNK